MPITRRSLRENLPNHILGVIRAAIVHEDDLEIDVEV